MTPLKSKSYVKMKLSDFPESVIAHYNLGEKATPDGFVYVATREEYIGFPKVESLPKHSSKHTL